jgi:hypothetical protein
MGLWDAESAPSLSSRSRRLSPPIQPRRRGAARDSGPRTHTAATWDDRKCSRVPVLIQKPDQGWSFRATARADPRPHVLSRLRASAG